MNDAPFDDEAARARTLGRVRVLRYRYRFAPRGSDHVWTRELEGVWLPPLSSEGVLRDALRQLGYVR